MILKFHCYILVLVVTIVWYALPTLGWKHFEEAVSTKYVSDLTTYHIDPKDDLRRAMFKSMAIVGNVSYYCERLDIGWPNARQGLVFSTSLDPTNQRREGYDILAEDPRLFVVKGQVYVIFITFQGIRISPFDKFQPILLKMNGSHIREKNWAPFVLNDVIHFVYSYDPLLVLYYDMNSEGLLKVAFRDHTIAHIPFDTQATVLRGGSNLVPMFTSNPTADVEYYIGGDHSRLIEPGPDSKHTKSFHFTHLAILNVKHWKVVYITKPVLFDYMKKGDDQPYCIQDPISVNRIEPKGPDMNTFLFTINIADTFSFVYEFNITITEAQVKEWDQQHHEPGHWQSEVRSMVKSLTDTIGPHNGCQQNVLEL